MVRYWASKPKVRSTADDSRTLSLNVLSRAGFGKSFPFQGHDEKSEASLAIDYKQSLQLVLDNCILIMVLGRKFLAKPWLPEKLRTVHGACASFQKYMSDLYGEEKSMHIDGRPKDRNLMTSLVQASQEEAKMSVGLSEAEIYGNMFVFNFAGHDTTAHTLTFVFMFLAANPTTQDWLTEELRYVFGNRRPEEWDYNSDYPRLKRCLSVLLETVRLYTPVPVAKWTGASAQLLKVNDKTITIPPNTMVIPSYAAIHSHPDHWGPDPLAWRPSRWIKSATPTTRLMCTEDEEIIVPQRGVYIPWSEGERSCPGKRFSQVEVVAALAAIFLDCRVDPVLESGESEEAARSRILHQIGTDSAQVLLLQMLHPERVPLVWRRK